MILLLRIALLPVVWTGLATAILFAADEIPPVRVGDEVEVLSFSKWYPGTVESFQDGKATVTFRWNNTDRTGEFELREMRFPNNEGHWLVWKDATGKSSVEARYISRTETDVTIRKADGSELTVPIESLHPTLRKQVAQTPVSSDLTFPVHVGDQVEVNYFSKWYDGTVKAVTGNTVTVDYASDDSRTSTKDFELEDIRFPNGEGHWMIWKDASGKFKVEARYISRTETDVTIRKPDGTEATVPIDALHPTLRQMVVENDCHQRAEQNRWCDSHSRWRSRAGQELVKLVRRHCQRRQDWRSQRRVQPGRLGQEDGVL